MNETLKRAGQLGLLARDLAAARCRRSIPARERAVRQVVDRLGLMHGLPQKIGQLLAFSEMDGSSPQFARLTENAPSLPAEEIFSEFERQTGRRVAKCFEWINRAGISASIGQVHRARLHDGREVAVKVQYPGLRGAVDADLQALGWLMAPMGGMRRDFDMAAYRLEIGRMLRAEMDFVSEARWLGRFAEWTRGWSGVEIPEVFPEFSNSSVLAMTWVDGVTLAEARQWSEADRRVAAGMIVKFFLHGVAAWRCLHADPHPGNYRFRRGERGVTLGVLDFGCVKELDAGFASGLCTLITEAMNGGLATGAANDVAWRAFGEMGFNAALLDPLRPRLGEMARLLCEPLTSPESCRVADWNPGGRLKELLGAERMAFRLAGPPAMIYFLRAFQGVLQYLRVLDVPVDWRSAWSAAMAARVPAHEPATSIQAVPAEPKQTMKSNSLNIRVTDAAETKVALSFDAAATDQLPLLVPRELVERLRERSIDLVQVATDARQRDYAPGELFTYEDGARTVRVWLA